MAIPGTCPVGTASIGTECEGVASKYLAVDAFEYDIEIPNFTLTTLGKLQIEDTEYETEPRDLLLQQAGYWFVESIEFSPYQFPDYDSLREQEGITISQIHRLAIESADDSEAGPLNYPDYTNAQGWSQNSKHSYSYSGPADGAPIYPYVRFDNLIAGATYRIFGTVSTFVGDAGSTLRISCGGSPVVYMNAPGSFDVTVVAEDVKSYVELYPFNRDTVTEVRLDDFYYYETGAGASIEYGHDVPDVIARGAHRVVIEGPLEIGHEVADVGLIQGSLLGIDSLELHTEIDPNSSLVITRDVDLSIELCDLYISIPDIWLGLPVECLSYDSTRERDGGIKLDQVEGGTPQAERWYTEDRFRFKLVWEAITGPVAEGVRGFFERYRYSEFVYTWPEDGTIYRCIVATDLSYNRLRTTRYWTAEIEMVGTEVTPGRARELISKGAMSLNRSGDQAWNT